MSRCLSRGIAVYSPHTSWDVVDNGLTDWLISCFGELVDDAVKLFLLFNNSRIDSEYFNVFFFFVSFQTVRCCR